MKLGIKRVRHYHGKRLIYLCVDHVEDELALRGKESLGSIIKECSIKYSTHRTNIYRWWNFYNEWGEISITIKERMQKLKKKCKRRRNVQPRHVQALRDIVNIHPEYFLDKYAEELAHQTHATFSLATISRILKEELGLSLQVCNEVARQRNENKRILYQQALATLLSLFEDTNVVIYIDETHKDRSAS